MFKKRRQRILNDFQETVKKFHDGEFGSIKYNGGRRYFYVKYNNIRDIFIYRSIIVCKSRLKKYMKMQSILSSEVDDD